MKISTQPKRVTRAITVQEPVDGTTFKQHKVIITYELTGRKEAIDIVKEENAPLLREVVKGWGDEKGRGGFRDDDDQPIPFNEDTLEMVINVPYVHRALLQAYFEAANGGKLGN